MCGKKWLPTKDNYRNETCSQTCGSRLGSSRAWSSVQLAHLRQFYAAYPPPGEIPVGEIAILLNKTPGAVRGMAHTLGIAEKRRKRGAPHKPKALHAEMCAYCGGLFLQKRQDADAKCCSQSCSAKKAKQDYPHPRGMAGKHHSPEVKQIIGQKSREYWAAMSEETRTSRAEKLQRTLAATPKCPRVSTYSWTLSGKRDDLGGLFVRSSWEANYARYLGWLVQHGQIACWQYEPRTFSFPVERGTRHYTPDFRVVLLDGTVEWHEVKGWLDRKSQTKLTRFAKYYPQEKLVLVGESEYRALAKDASRFVPNWEGANGRSRGVAGR